MKFNSKKILYLGALAALNIISTICFASIQPAPKISDDQSCGQTTCCGGAWISSCASTTPIDSNMFELTIKTNSNAQCGGSAPRTWQQPMMYGEPLSNLRIYHFDQTGCGGANWDIGGKAFLSGGLCDQSICVYNVFLVSTHNGVGGQCQCNNETSYMIFVPKP